MVFSSSLSNAEAQIRVSKIVNNSLVDVLGQVDSRICRKILNFLKSEHCTAPADQKSESALEDLLSNIIEPPRARLITKFIFKHLNREPSLLERLSDSSANGPGANSDKFEKLKMIQERIASRMGKIPKSESQSPTTENTNEDNEADKGESSTPSDQIISLMTPKFEPTLKANKRMVSNESGKKSEPRKSAPKTAHKNFKPQPSFQDDRIAIKPMERGAKSIEIVDHEPLIKKMAQKAQKQKLEDIQRRIAEKAQKTGISDAARFSYIDSKSDAVTETPIIEWWDQHICNIPNQELAKFDSMPAFTDADCLGDITDLIEHPIVHKPSNVPAQEVKIPLHLTSKEMKKLRRKNRAEAHQIELEKIKLGLVEPPPPKVKMRNLMSALKDEAVQDPTKMEKFVMEQAEKRLEKHVSENQQRKLTKEQKRAKKIRKISEDVSLGVHVVVFAIKKLNNPSWRFKIEQNINQLHMSGFCAITKNLSVVVAEGGQKQIAKFRRLMLNRIDFDDPNAQKVNSKLYREEGSEKDDIKLVKNNCTLIWEGTVQSRSFGSFKQEIFQNEMLAREVFRKSSVEHYWDSSYSTALKSGGDAV